MVDGWWIAGGGAALTLVAALADRARLARRDLDRVGFMPWRGLSLIGIVLVVLGVALARAGR